MTVSGPPQQAPAQTLSEEMLLVEGLRRGDEATFVEIVNRYHAPMVRLAMMYVSSREHAEDVVQETWLGLLRGIHQFEMRSSLKTWMFHILVNRAKTRARRDARTIPFSAVVDPAHEAEPSVDPERFLGSDHPRWPRHWVQPPQAWDDLPEDRFIASETQALLKQAIVALPPHQREVITMRDLEGWSADEVCQALGISEANQRVLLHRARSKVRRALETYFGEH